MLWKINSRGPVRKYCVSIITVLVALVGLSLWLPVAQADGYVSIHTYRFPPSLPGKHRTLEIHYGCYSVRDGEPINCTFTHKVNGLSIPESDPDNNGGHSHYTNRPHSYDNKPLLHSGDLDPSPFGVAGFTSLSSSQLYAEIIHEVPEVSGNLSVSVSVVAPYGWYCTGGCFTYDTVRFEETYDIGIRDLATLPDEQFLYFKVRIKDEDHLDSVAFNGTQYALQMLPLIAENYYVLSGQTLSINDMSLVKGGLFDYKVDWAKPHSSHREGKDADINQAGGIPCFKDRDLRLAVDQLLNKVKTSSGNTRSALLCEICKDTGTYCRKHIDLEWP